MPSLEGENPMTAEDVAAELDRLNRLLAARDGKPGYKANCEAIRSRIAAIEALEQPAA